MMCLRYFFLTFGLFVFLVVVDFRLVEVSLLDFFVVDLFYFLSDRVSIDLVVFLDVIVDERFVLNFEVSLQDEIVCCWELVMFVELYWVLKFFLQVFLLGFTELLFFINLVNNLRLNIFLIGNIWKPNNDSGSHSQRTEFTKGMASNLVNRGSF